eukprot:COSAG01_NODE_3086_length_6611_cov_12.899109_6_plen_123_part_00
MLIAQPLHEARKVKKYKIIMEISKKLECVLLFLIAGSDRHSKMVGHAAAPAGGCTHGQQRRAHVFVSDGVGGVGGGGGGGRAAAVSCRAAHTERRTPPLFSLLILPPQQGGRLVDDDWLAQA